MPMHISKNINALNLAIPFVEKCVNSEKTLKASFMQVQSFVGRKKSVKRMITTLPLYINITRLGYFAVLELIQSMH